MSLLCVIGNLAQRIKVHDTTTGRYTRNSISIESVIILPVASHCKNNSDPLTKQLIHYSSANKFNLYIGKQRNNNNGYQEAVTSIHFVKVKTIIFYKTPWIQTQASSSFSGLQSCAMTTRPLTHWCLR